MVAPAYSQPLPKVQVGTSYRQPAPIDYGGMGGIKTSPTKAAAKPGAAPAAAPKSNAGAAMATFAIVEALGTAYSAYVTAGLQRDLSKLERQQYDMNAAFANLQADDSIRRGARAAQEHLVKTRGLIGAQRANIAGQNVRVDVGSAAEIQADTAASGAMDALTIRNNAWREAWGLRAQAAGLQGQGALAQIKGQAAAAETLATGGANMVRTGFDRYLAYKKYA